ncbi:MAG: aminotransferase class V-fold PLP-dependent enzyme, partial [Opitutus sp.]
TGLLLPVREIAALARQHDLWFHIDGAQSAGMIPVNLAEIGCDSYAISGHKWLGGPHETGVLFLRRSKIDLIAPTGIGAHSGELTFLPGALVYSAAASRHEYGTRNAASIVALGEAIRLQEEIGRERIAQHGHALATSVIAACEGFRGIQLLTPKDPRMRGSMATFHHERADASTFFSYLRKQHSLRCRPVTEQGLEAVRISFHVFNSTADATRVAAALHAAATDL